MWHFFLDFFFRNVIIESENHFQIGVVIMHRNDNYNTKQKDIILDAIKCHSHEFTVKDIYEYLNHKVGLTTIYRMVDKLFNDGILNKSISRDNITYYQYLSECDEENHFYLKCNCCGDIVHIDCDCIKDLSNHIINNHKFILDKKNIIINGICEKCYNRGVIC